MRSDQNRGVHVKRKRLTNEIRFRASTKDLERIDYILKDRDITVSALMREMISGEHARLKLEERENDHGSEEESSEKQTKQRSRRRA